MATNPKCNTCLGSGHLMRELTAIQVVDGTACDDVYVECPTCRGAGIDGDPRWHYDYKICRDCGTGTHWRCVEHSIEPGGPVCFATREQSKRAFLRMLKWLLAAGLLVCIGVLVWWCRFGKSC